MVSAVNAEVHLCLLFCEIKVNRIHKNDIGIKIKYEGLIL